MLEVAEVLKQSEVFRLSWFDQEKTIIVLEIFRPWTWEDAFASVPLLNQTVEQQPHAVYSVYHYYVKSSALLPHGSNLTKLRRLLELDPPNERLVFFVRQDVLTTRLMNALSSAYGLSQLMKKYRFVMSWQEALEQIEADKAQAG
ncbi:MAG: hypothetical protein NZ750_08250 [Anaerolineae bacterium]|nr:hypothetical protein [Anaerolineae bacterium]MDW8172340.1 hypothetical protein [Anaerolineae bacterium]